MLVLGIGNEMMGDDAFGPLVIEKLKKKNVSAELWSGSTPENFITKIKGPIEKLILLDTADLGEPPGTVKKINPSLVSRHFISTHKIPLSFLIKMQSGLIFGNPHRGTTQIPGLWRNPL